MELTKQQARNFLLAYQKLLPPRGLKGKEGVYKFIDHVRCIQYDPLNMVGYNPYLVLQSRIKDFKPLFLTDLLYKDRELIDGWDKCMSIYMTEDWAFFTRYRENATKRYNSDNDFLDEIAKIREFLKQEGPLSSIDIKMEGKMDWAWAPTRVARAALESMNYTGELIIHHKVGTRKVYDFAKDHLPMEVLEQSDPNDTMQAYFRWHIKRRIRSVGILWNRASDAFLGIRWMKSKDRMTAFSQLAENGDIVPILVKDIDYTFYICKEDEELLQHILNGVKITPQVSFIAPLDNVIWDRKLIKELFDFDYKWEVYTPSIERKYGYYVLPVLYGNKFIGRFEPKFHQKTGLLEIINWWWEGEITPTKRLMTAIKRAIIYFIKYLGATRLISNCNDSIINNIVELIKEEKNI